MSLLRFEHVTKQYEDGHVALSELDFALKEGEIAFITGHSGAGKSTVLKLIHLSERPTRGTIVFDDRNLARITRSQIAMHRRNIGVVYQDHRLLIERTVGENVSMPLLLRGVRRVETVQRVRKALEYVGLGDRHRALPGQLSLGEQQRVGIARAIVANPRLLVADEPTGNLDPSLAAEIMSLFSKLPAQGTTVLIVSHDLTLIKHMRQRVLVLDHGRLVDDIAPQDLAN